MQIAPVENTVRAGSELLGSAHRQKCILHALAPILFPIRDDFPFLIYFKQM